MTHRKMLRALFLATLMVALGASFAASQTAAAVPTLGKFSRTVREAPTNINRLTFALYKMKSRAGRRCCRDAERGLLSEYEPVQ
jgi:hypothetical protein